MRQLYREQRDVLAETLMGREAGRLDVAYLSDGSSDRDRGRSPTRRHRQS
jgi:hypothetical protein